MNFTLDRDLLDGLISRVQGVADRRHTMQILSHALIRAAGNRVTAVSSDLEIVIRCTQEAKVDREGAVALPAKKLADIARVLPKGPVKFELLEGNAVRISGTSGQFRLAGLSAQEFPEMPEVPAGEGAPVDADLFRKLADRVLPFASADEARFHLSGILAESVEEGGKKLLRLVATDGHRLAVSEGECSSLSALLGGRKTLVPRKGILEIRRLAETGPGSLSLSASEKFLFAGKGDTEIWVRLLDAEFPDYRQVVPKENRLVATLEKDAFSQALKRVGVMAPEKINLMKLAFTKGRLEVSTTSPDLGEASDSLPADYDGEEVRIGFNGKYLQDALGGIDGDKLTVEMRDGQGQALFRPVGGEGFMAIVMPMRLS
jgi:DNA polymerase-3 subunit beta